MVAEYAPKSRCPVRDTSPHFPVFVEFKDASYIKRYDVLCQRLVLEQLYTTAAVIAVQRSDADTGKYADVSDTTSLKVFVTSLAGHVAYSDVVGHSFRFMWATRSPSIATSSRFSTGFRRASPFVLKDLLT